MNLIESAFAGLKLRTASTKGASSKAMAFKLLFDVQKSWKRIRGYEEIGNLLAGALYKDGTRVDDTDDWRGAA